MFRFIFWLFILFLALSFFGISLQEIINSPAGQANLAYLATLFTDGWHWFIGYIQQFKVY